MNKNHLTAHLPGRAWARIILLSFFAFFSPLMGAFTNAQGVNDDIMRKEGDEYIVNTSTLCEARGFKATTPLEVHIKNDKVINIVALPNKESKGYFFPMLKKLIPLYSDLKVSKALKQSEKPSVDATTGATFSGKSVQANINAALRYYKAHK